MSDSVKRLKEFMDDKALTSKSLAAKIGVQPSTFSHYFKGRNSPSANVMNKLLVAYPELNSDWLFRGVGPKYNENSNKGSDASLFPEYKQHEVSDVSKQFEQSSLFEQSVNHSDNEAQSISIKSGAEPHTIIKEVVKQVPSKIITRIVVYYSDNTYEDFLAR